MGVLIGLHGRAGAGKDTVCGFMREWGESRGVTVRREAFADRLKLSAARIFHPEIGLEDAVAWCNRVKAGGVVRVSHDSATMRITGRELLQRYGTEAHRDVFGTDFWIDATLGDLSADFTVVTDVRFENEAEAIRSRGGEVWSIERPGEAIAAAHASERPLPDHMVDRALPNWGTLLELRDDVFRMMDWKLQRG